MTNNEEDRPISVMPDDPCIEMSQAITQLEAAARHAFDYGRFWMREHDHAHGRRWFARSRELAEMAERVRVIQFHSLHPQPVGTPTRRSVDEQVRKQE